jgi:tocopherol O-methyltransferase
MLNEQIGYFYDTSTKLWLNTWGEHMHHGYYGVDGKQRKSNQQAQIDLIQELLRWGQVQQPKYILDAGCGVGGSARYLAILYGAEILGLTLSAVQAHEAERLNKAVGLEHSIEIIVKDMLTLDATYGAFDLVWSMESAEHIPDKQRLLETFYSALRPGGKFLMATWCIRTEPPFLAADEQAILKKIEQYYHIPPMISIEKYHELATNTGFVAIKTADWTTAVSPFWMAVIRSAFSIKSLVGLLKSGMPAIKGAWAMQFMTKAYKMGILKFGVIQGTKA